MKYSVLIINSSNIYDFWENTADGIRYNNLERFEVDELIKLSLEQDFSVVVQKYEEEE